MASRELSSVRSKEDRLSSGTMSGKDLIVNWRDHFEDDEDNELEIDWKDYYVGPRMLLNLALTRLDLCMIIAYVFYATMTIYMTLEEFCLEEEISKMLVDDCRQKYILKPMWIFAFYILFNLAYVVFLLVYYVMGCELMKMDYGHFGYIRRQYKFIQKKEWRYALIAGITFPILTVLIFTAYFNYFAVKKGIAGWGIASFGFLYMIYMYYEAYSFHALDALLMDDSADAVDFNQSVFESSINTFMNFEGAILALILRNDESVIRKYGVNGWEIPVFINALKFDRSDDLMVAKVAKLAESYLGDKAHLLTIERDSQFGRVSTAQYMSRLSTRKRSTEGPQV